MKFKIRFIVALFAMMSVNFCQASSEVGLTLNTAEEDEQKLRIEGLLQNYSEGEYSTLQVQDLSKHTVITEVKINILKKVLPLCQASDWELFGCSDCSRKGLKTCHLRIKEGGVCQGEDNKPPNFEICSEKEWPICRSEDWLIQNCSTCDSEGYKYCQINKVDGVYCQDQATKPDFKQKCPAEKYEFGELIGFQCGLYLPVASDFTDIISNKNYSFIEQLRLWGVVHGKRLGVYEPNTSLTRAEFTKIALNTFCIDIHDNQEGNYFPDVSRDEWFFQYITKAFELNIIEGYRDGFFRPNQVISKVEALKIMLETADLKIEEVGGDWYQKYLVYADKEDILEIVDVHSNDTISRGEMAKVAVRTKEVKGENLISRAILK